MSTDAYGAGYDAAVTSTTAGGRRRVRRIGDRGNPAFFDTTNRPVFEGEYGEATETDVGA